MRDTLINIGKVIVSLVLIVFVFSRVDVNTLRERLANANWLLLVFALVAYFGAIITNCVKWAILLQAQVRGVPFFALLRYTFIGVFFNNLLPANIGGDVMRGYELSAHTERKLDAAASVIVDRLIGLLAFVTSAAVASAVAIVTIHLQSLNVVGFVAIVALAALVLIFAVLFSRRLRIRISHLFNFALLRPFAPIYGRLADAFSAYRFRYKTLFIAFIVGVCGLMLTNIVNYALSESLGGGISFLAICLFNPLIGLVLLIPISIGGIGINQNAYVFFYGLVSVPRDHALAVSLLMQGLIIISSLPGGLLWLRAKRASTAQKT